MKTLCGVDVSADFLDARVRPGEARLRVERTAEGIEVLAAFCREHGVQLVVMEATGGYERGPFKLLWGAGLPCAIVNPRQVRRFADAMGFLEKTDDIDAGKPRKVVRIALARKLLVRLNAKARDVRKAIAMPIAA
jgi:transposase